MKHLLDTPLLDTPYSQTLDWTARDKQTGLLRRFINYGRNFFIIFGPNGFWQSNKESYGSIVLLLKEGEKI